ncbi:MAG: MATE family efflux transporter, partial [Pseudomonadota bacterium]
IKRYVPFGFEIYLTFDKHRNPRKPVNASSQTDDQEDSTGDDTQPREIKLNIWQLAWPAIVANLLFSMVGIVATKVVGDLGASAIAAVTVGHRMFFLSQAVLMALSVGATALVARAWGADDKEEAARVTSASVWISIGVAFALTVPAYIFAYSIAAFFDLDEETTSLAAEFIRYLSIFNVAFAINIVMSSALRAAGDTMTPLWIGGVTNVINIFLLYWLVFGMYGLPALGVGGAALANGIAFALGAIMFIGAWLSGWLIIKPSKGISLTRERLKQLLHISYPAAIEQGIFQAGFLAFLWIVAFYGKAPYAAYGIGVNILSLAFVVGFGFSIAGSTLVGQHLGAKDSEGAARSGWRAMRLSILTMMAFAIVIAAAAEPIARFMIDDDEVVRLTVIFIYIMSSVQPLMAIEFSVGGALRGAGDTRFPLYATIAGLLGARVLLAVIMMQLGFSVEWIYAALIADYVVKAIMLVMRFRSGRWKTVIN